MTDYNSDQGRELRRARLTIVRPIAAKTHMPRAAFITEYKDPHILRRVAMTEVEETDRIMFCPACVKTMEGDDEFVEAHKLHVGYEEDPLRNFPVLVNVACKGCGWSEIIPVELPKGLSEDELKELNEYKSVGLRSGVLGQYQGMSIHQQRQAGKSAMLAAGYGMGQAGLQQMASQMQQAQAAQLAALPPLMKYGQRIADSIWGKYDEDEKLHKEAEVAKGNNASRRYMEELQAQQSAAMAKQIDKQIMETLAKDTYFDKIRINTPKKYAPLPPSAPPKLAEMHEQAKEALVEMVRHAPTDEHRASLLKKLKEMFK